MKKTRLLLAGAAMLLTACSKEESTTPTPIPIGDGTGKFTFSVDTAAYKVDTLFVNYTDRDGQTKSQTLLNQSSWNSPDLLFKNGDSIQAAVKAVGTLKKANPDAPAAVSFQVYPSTIAVPTVKKLGGGASNSSSSNRFTHNSNRSLRFD